MVLLIIVIVSLVVLGLIAGTAGWIRMRRLQRQLDKGEIDEIPPVRTIDQECCGQHEVCERDSLLAAVSKAIEYYDDEELDRYHGREGSGYTDEEADEFRDILYTMKNEDVAGWVRSLQLRAINLPDAVKDEVFMIIGERRSSSSKTLPLLFILFSLFFITACSTKKNTGITRLYHRFTAHYNTTFNGEQAFLEGLEAQEKGHKDNFAELLPMYTPSVQATAGMGKSNYDRAIEKAEKAIKKHSIKVKPKRKGNGRMSAKEKAYRNRREFNNYLQHPWMMLAESQFRKGEFIEAAATYNYIIRLYSDQPNVVSVARAWLARCYVMLEWPYDAEDLLRKMARDSMTVRGAREREKSLGAYHLLTGQYAEAVPYLRTAAKYEKRPKQRARLNYLLGQVAQLAGDNRTAYKAWQRVIRSNPPYELAINARLRQCEVLSATNGDKMLRRLRRMAREEKNKNYLEQVYHAMGNVYLAKGDTMRAIYAMKEGLEKAMQSGPAKNALALHLGQLYWDKENYIDAADCYVMGVGGLDKKHPDYAEASRRNDILKDLAPPLSDVKLQDSLLALSLLPEKEYLAAIDRVIKELKRKEKEEAKRNGEDGASNAAAANASAQNNRANPMQQRPQSMNKPGEKGPWYFYNAQAVTQGKQMFERQWGKRALEDNWRRLSKQQENVTEDDAVNYDNDESADDIEMEEEMSEEDKRIADSLANDPHHREFYLRQIPFDDDAKAAAHATIAEGLFKAGMIEITPLENYPLAERTLQRLLTEYPEFDRTPDVYYNMFLLYGRQSLTDQAQACRDTIIERWPDHQYAVLLRNPRYEQNARYGKHIEDSLYATAYSHYLVAEYDDVEPLYDIHTEDFPDGPHRGRMLFVRAMSNLYNGRTDTFMVTMKQLVEKYSSDSLSRWGKELIKGVQEGRILNSDGMDMSSLWSRREWTEGADSATIAADTLSADMFTSFAFVLAWPANELDANQLLYEMARYNFSTFVARNFDIEMVQDGKIHQLVVRGFNNYDEVHAYVQQMYMDERLRTRLEGIRSLLISEENLKRIGHRYSYDDYDEFYQLYFTPQEIPDDLRIDEPEVEIIDPENIDPNEQQDEEPSDDDSTTDFEWPF